MGTWIDFKKLRSQLDNERVLADYGVKLVGNGNQRRAKCPLPSHTEDTGKVKPFSVKLNHGIWRCFSCGCQGNMIDFVALMEGLDPELADDIRKAAIKLHEKYVVNAEPVAEKQGKSPQSHRPDQPKRLVNSPLDFELKNLDQRPSYLLNRGFTAETIEAFGLGYCSKGMFAGRIAIPIHNAAGELIGYAGRLIFDETIDKDHPKYLYPESRVLNGVTHEFDKSLVLYNARRLYPPVSKLIVVEAFASAWWLWQSVYPNVVATMATSCSAEQAKQIVDLTKDTGSVWIVSADCGKHTRFAAETMAQVSPHRAVRWIKLPDKPVTALSKADLAEMLWKV